MVSSVSAGLLRARSIALITIPGVQNPHCRPWLSRNAACIGCKVPSALATPSMVTISEPLACIARMLQLFTALPFMWMVQAPHCAVSQAMWVPVRRSVSRMKSTSNVRGSASPLTDLPLTVMLIFMGVSSWFVGFFSLMAARAINRRCAAYRRNATSDGTNVPEPDNTDAYKTKSPGQSRGFASSVRCSNVHAMLLPDFPGDFGLFFAEGQDPVQRAENHGERAHCENYVSHSKD